MRPLRSFTRPSGRSLSLFLMAFACLLLSDYAAIAAPALDKERAAPTITRKITRASAMNIPIGKSVPITLSRPAATVFIATPDIADVQVLSATSVVVVGKKVGQTSLVITDDKGEKLAYKTITVTQNLSNLRRAINAISSRAHIKVKSIPNGILLTGTAPDSSVIEDSSRLAQRYIPETGGDIINRIKIKANNQVQIHVRFAEVSKDVDKRFGINWEAVGSAGSLAFGMATGPDFYTAGEEILRTTVGDSTNDAFFTSFSSGDVSINGMLDLLTKEGFVTILAEPSLTALSGQTASFLAGGEFPVPVPQSADTISIEWKQYGVSLAFTPTIINGDRINLHVRPEVSQLSDIGSIVLNNITIPALITRRAETTLELNSGQSFALAGLLNNQQTQSVEKFPFLGDLPILGTLFRSSRFQNNESELVIIITPYIVKPTTEEKLSLPTDGIVTPTDSEFFFGKKNLSDNYNSRPLSGDARAVKNVPAPRARIAMPTPLAVPMQAVKKTPVEVQALPPKKKVPKTKKKLKKAVTPIPSKKPQMMPLKKMPKKRALPQKTVKKIPAKPVPSKIVTEEKFPISRSLPSKVEAPAPSGPGGFIVE